MNIYKSIVILTVVIMSSLVLSTGAQTFEDKVEMIQGLNETLKSGCVALVDHIEDTQMQPPLIYSKWYVDRLAETDPDRAKLEYAWRTFGRNLLERLEAMSNDILSMSKNSEREVVAEALLYLANWFRSRPGYGNAFLYSRCQDLATVPLAHLIADLEYPEDKLEILVGRLRHYEEDYDFFAQALNTESPETIFSAARSGSAIERSQPMAKVWAKGGQKILKYRKQEGENDIYEQSAARRKTLPEDVQFYCDDRGKRRSRSEYTTLARWDRKEHHQLVLGLGTHNPKRVKNLYRFRLKVGAFPTEVPAWWDEGDPHFKTSLQAAFEMAWKPYRSEFGPSIAAEVLESVLGNTFFDHDRTLTNVAEQ